MNYLSVLLLFFVVVSFVVLTMIATHLLGPKRYSERKSDAFECGIVSEGNARVPFSVHYFLIAILFVLFDVEIIFFYPWAVNFKALGWGGFFAVILFTSTVAVSLVYLIREKLLDFCDGGNLR